MRTIIANMLRGLTPRSETAKQDDTGRDYEVEGCLIFVLKSRSDVVDPVAIVDMIHETDKRFPWKDPVTIRTITGGVFCVFDYSIYNSLEGVPVRTYNKNAQREKQWHFCIMPIQSDMRRGQLLGYENYLARLAEELAKKGIPCVKEVRSKITITSGKSFRVDN